MSSKELARRASVEVTFGGVDITDSIKPYFKSLSYIDAEDGQSDDLQLTLQDRDLIWLQDWLGQAISTASEEDTETEATEEAQASDPNAGTYTVTPKIGLNVRTGGSTSYSKVGALCYGTSVYVSKIENGWAQISYSGQDRWVCASYLKKVSDADTTTTTDDSEDESEKESTFNSRLKISAVILRENWNGDGKDDILECGEFELDAVTYDGPPNEVTIKGTSLPYQSTIRQQEKSQAWENYYLSGIAQEMASRNGMACMYEAETNPYYDRVEQFKTSDICFLQTLCDRTGISLKATNNILVLYDQATYEAKSEVLTVSYSAGQYEKYKLYTSTADSEYSSCRVSYVLPSGQLVEGTAYVEDYTEDNESNQQLEITEKVSTSGEAKILAAKYLRLHNKYAKYASITFPGNPALVSGVTILLEGWGHWDGKYIAVEARHTVSNSGYTTTVKARAVLEGY